MKHVDIIVKNDIKTSISDMIATISGNNFGDQIIEYKIYKLFETPMQFKNKLLNMYGYETFKTVINLENSHWSQKEIIKYGKTLV